MNWYLKLRNGPQIGPLPTTTKAGAQQWAREFFKVQRLPPGTVIWRA